VQPFKNAAIRETKNAAIRETRQDPQEAHGSHSGILQQLHDIRRYRSGQLPVATRTPQSHGCRTFRNFQTMAYWIAGGLTLEIRFAPTH
jgi:hypothetical protein